MPFSCSGPAICQHDTRYFHGKIRVIGNGSVQGLLTFGPPFYSSS